MAAALLALRVRGSRLSADSSLISDAMTRRAFVCFEVSGSKKCHPVRLTLSHVLLYALYSLLSACNSTFLLVVEAGGGKSRVNGK